MKEIIQRKLFWAILIILLLAVFVYPPCVATIRGGVVTRREWGWDWVFSRSFMMEIDIKLLLVEAIIAFLLTIGFFLIPFRKIAMLFGCISSGMKESFKKERED